MFKKTAILTIAVLMAGLLAVPVVMAVCYVPDCTHPNCPACGVPDCPDCAAHQWQCQSGQTKQFQNQQGPQKMQMGKVWSRARNKNINQKWVRIYLYEKDPVTWNIINGPEGAWGFLDYQPQGEEFTFLFVGKKLVPFEDYTLIYYPDPWPGTGLMCLGDGQADGDGKVKIKGKGDPVSNPGCGCVGPADTGDLPADYDANGGAKIWLVLADDVNCQDEPGPDQMTNWNPEEYLFENTLITFVDTSDDL